MASTLTPSDQVHLAARLYYVDHLPQAQVARLCRVSQAKVSRLLAAARREGIVRITVADYDPREAALEKRVAAQLGLDRAIVIRTAAGVAIDDLRKTLAHFAAPLVSRAIAPGKATTLAIAGGRTLRELAAVLRPSSSSPAAAASKSRELTVVPAMGHVDSSVTPVDASELARAVAARFDGALLTLNAPAFVPDRRTRDALRSLGQVRSAFRRLASADAALVGVGTLENSVFVERGVLTRADIARLRQAGAVGEICGRFFDARGRECATPLRDRVVGIALDDLRRVPNVIAVVAGGDRAAALAAAARGGLIKSLVIDAAGAASPLGEPRGEGDDANGDE